jgi:hypothetical protein
LPDWDGEKVLEANCAADSFAEAVRNTAQTVWNEYGAEGYNSAWCGRSGFPLRALRALTAALSVAEPLPSAMWR